MLYVKFLLIIYVILSSYDMYVLVIDLFFFL